MTIYGKSIILTALILFVIGCAGLKPPHPISSSQWNRPDEASAFFSRLTDEITRLGRGNAYYHPIPGFPHLRTTRFLASLKTRLDTRQKQRLWLEWLMEAGSKARRAEIFTLPDSSLEALSRSLGEPLTRQSLIEKADRFSKAIMRADLNDGALFKRLIATVSYSSEYSMVMKIIGLYPAAAIPVAALTMKVRNEFKEWYEGPRDHLPVKGRLTAYAPGNQEDRAPDEIRRMISRSFSNPLGVPILSADQKIRVASVYAPILVPDVAQDYDKPGQMVWRNEKLTVDTEKPSVYYYFSHAQYRGQTVLQVNYVVWFAGRLGPEPPWIERGLLDGLTFRITFGPDGTPVILDGMNNCGCYHFFVPRKDKIEGVIPRSFKPDPFVPQYLPDLPSGNRFEIRIHTGWHQVQRVTPAPAPLEYIPYDLVPYGVLERLPQPGGTFESIFNPSGIVKGSGRIEPLFLFSMGIAEIGSMRQRGHHAISFFEHDHFDDPDLLDSSFTF